MRWLCAIQVYCLHRTRVSLTSYLLCAALVILSSQPWLMQFFEHNRSFALTEIQKGDTGFLCIWPPEPGDAGSVCSCKPWINFLWNALYNSGIGSRHCGINMFLEGTKIKWTGKKIIWDMEIQCWRIVFYITRLPSHSHQTLSQFSCKMAGKSLTTLKQEIEVFMMAIIMFVTAGDWI